MMQQIVLRPVLRWSVCIIRKFKSSDEKIATVNSTGEVKGVSKGEVTIIVTAGKITKKIKLTVKVATTEIKIDSAYLILKPGQTHQIKASVVPADASQGITYKSVDAGIASVSSSGLIIANKCGNGTVIVQNDDTSTAIAVIVDEALDDTEVHDKVEDTDIPVDYDNEIHSGDCSVISSEMLKYYEENSLSGKYVYLYNDSKNKYELLKEHDVNVLKLDIAGKYLVSDRKLTTGKIKLVIVVVFGIILLVLLCVYIGVKKRYWFW